MHMSICVLPKHTMCILEMTGKNYKLAAMTVSAWGTGPQRVVEGKDIFLFLLVSCELNHMCATFLN